MWSSTKSLWLSKVCTLAFFLALVAVAALAPRLVNWFIGYSHAELEGTQPYFLVSIYSGCLPAAFILAHLYRLLYNIGSDRVFIRRNVSALRLISWGCFAGALICIVSTMYYYPWLIVSVAAAFTGLIVRVVKNVFAQAVILQEEADYTI